MNVLRRFQNLVQILKQIPFRCCSSLARFREGTTPDARCPSWCSGLYFFYVSRSISPCPPSVVCSLPVGSMAPSVVNDPTRTCVLAVSSLSAPARQAVDVNDQTLWWSVCGLEVQSSPFCWKTSEICDPVLPKVFALCLISKQVYIEQLLNSNT